MSRDEADEAAVARRIEPPLRLAFGDDALLFAIAYAIARWLHIFIWAEANENIDTRQAIVRLARTALPAPALLIAAAFVDDGTTRAVIWIVALLLDLAGPFVFGVRGFRVSARHFAERFGLIVIIALGESIVAIGAGVSSDLDAGIIVAAGFGLIVSCALWWAYFDVWALITETRFRQARGHTRVLIARDVYSYLHLPMTAGVVLIALGIKKTIGDVDEPLKVAPAAALFGGIALYYAGHIGIRWRMTHTLFRGRVVALVVSVALIPVATKVDALLALGLAAVLTSAVILYEVLRYSEDRHRIRAEAR